jgi:hypothetical protein
MSDSYGNNSPLAPGVDGNMVGTDRVVPPGPAPTWAVPPAPSGLKH